MVGLPGDNINSYYRTSVTKNCRAPGRNDWAPGLKYLDTPVILVISLVRREFERKYLEGKCLSEPQQQISSCLSDYHV